MTEQEWSDLLNCIIAAQNLSTNGSTLDAADRAHDWIMRQEWT